jgi:DNA-binding response OmpR family regulator
VLRRVREDNAVPVIVLSGMSDEADRIVGLELGADDYVVKPFSPRELVARVRSVLRRTRGTASAGKVEFDDLLIDLTTREVWARGEMVELRRREFDLLAHLASSPRQVFTRDQLLLGVWEVEPEWQGAATVSEHVHRLRAKIEVDPAHPTRIVTVRGVGYRFEP